MYSLGVVVEKRNQQEGAAPDPREGRDTNGFPFLRCDRCLLGDDTVFRPYTKQ